MWGGKWFGKWFGKWMGYHTTPFTPVDDPEGLEFDLDLSVDHEVEGVRIESNINYLHFNYVFRDIQDIIDEDDTVFDMGMEDDYEIDMSLESDHVLQSSLEINCDVDCNVATDLDTDRIWTRQG